MTWVGAGWAGARMSACMRGGMPRANQLGSGAACADATQRSPNRETVRVCA
jgi:hypothetical protein